jgi:hypothetical protein
VLHGRFGRRRRTSAAGERRPQPAEPARFPRHPAVLLATTAWRPLAQLADQRIRAHHDDHLEVGALIETVSTEIEAVLLDEPMGMLLAAWTAWDDELRRLEGRAGRLPEQVDDVDDVAEALAVHADLVALVPQLVVSRLSENVR